VPTRLLLRGMFFTIYWKMLLLAFDYPTMILSSARIAVCPHRGNNELSQGQSVAPYKLPIAHEDRQEAINWSWGIFD
jgi:hypothetical protein